MASRPLPACYPGSVASTYDRLADLAPERVRPLKRVEFERLVESGAFDEDERIELLGGVLVEMSPQNPSHAGTVDALSDTLWRVAGTLARVRVQLPFAASGESLPEPDIALVARSHSFDAHPASAFLIVEVAEASLRKDRLIKAAIYARAGVPEYWIVNLAERVVEVHTSPRDGAYAAVRAVGRTEAIRLVALPDLDVAVSDFLK
jgi:Uma2 family endonuclease